MHLFQACLYSMLVPLLCHWVLLGLMDTDKTILMTMDMCKRESQTEPVHGTSSYKKLLLNSQLLFESCYIIRLVVAYSGDTDLSG